MKIYLELNLLLYYGILNIGPAKNLKKNPCAQADPHAGGNAIDRQPRHHIRVSKANAIMFAFSVLAAMFTAGKHSSNDDLVNSLQAKGLLKTQTIIAAFRGVDRGAFFPSELQGGDVEVYDDKPLKIGVVHQSAPHMCERRGALCCPVCSAAPSKPRPFMYAHILELLQVQPGDRVLNIGSGTGYLRCF
jgi:hypothetical protein